MCSSYIASASANPLLPTLDCWKVLVHGRRRRVWLTGSPGLQYQEQGNLGIGIKEKFDKHQEKIDKHQKEI